MQGLQRAEGAEESQGHKVVGIHRPCLGSVCAQRGDCLNFTLGQKGFDIHPRAQRDICFEYAGSGLGPPGRSPAKQSQGQAVLAKDAMRIIGQQGLCISIRPKKQGHNRFFKSLAEGQVDLPTQIDRIQTCIWQRLS